MATTVWDARALQKQCLRIVNMWDAAGIIGHPKEALHVLQAVLGTGKLLYKFMYIHTEIHPYAHVHTHTCVQ